MFDAIFQNARFDPALKSINWGAANADIQGSGDNYATAFSGIQGIQQAVPLGNGSYQVVMTTPGQADPYNAYQGTVQVAPDGSISSGSDWAPFRPDSTSNMLKQFALGSLAMAGGLYGLNALGGAGATGGAAGVGGGGAAGGAGAAAGASPYAASLAGGGAGSAAATAGQLAGASTLGAVDPIAAAAAGLGAEGLGVAPASASLLPAGVGGGSIGGALGTIGTFAKENPNLLNIGGSLINGLIGSNAAGKAADAQVNAANQANALQKYMYETTRADYAPWMKAGGEAITRANGLLTDPTQITRDPGYQFGLTQGQTAIDRSAASRGGLYSGATLKALQRYGTDYGQTKLTDSLNRNLAVAGQGQAATGGVSNAGQGYATNAGNNITGAGNSRASGYVGSANAWGGALNNAFNTWQQNNMLRQLGYGG